jgi:phage tail-like protein
MTEFPTNPNRFDPYKNFNFRVKWDGAYIPAISRVTGLIRTTAVVEHREGGDPSSSRKSTGLTQFDSITLERGLTDDTAFEDWANLVWKLGAGLGSEMSLNDFRKTIYIELYNEAGLLVRAYTVYRCWPSVYQALPVLDSDSNAIAIESILLQHEGWERDTSVVEPSEPNLPSMNA